MQKKFIYRSALITYRIEGKGKPVVLLHGFGEDSHIWDTQVAFLKEHCLLIIPDLPGSGESGMLHLTVADKNIPHSPRAAHPVSIDDYADCLHALLQHENITSCTLLGHSMGGYITLAFAEKYPSLLTGFGLVHSTAFADSEEKKRIREKGIAFMEQYGAQAFLKTGIPNLFANRFKENHPEKIAALAAAGAGFTKEALQQYYRAMMTRPDRAHVLKSNPCPVLFVMGTEDIAAPLAEVLQQTHLPDKSYIHVLQDVGHMSMWEATKDVNRFLLAFIDR